MLSRTLEPEVMDTPEEARDYDAMDHREVNRRFTDDFLTLFATETTPTEAEAGSARVPDRPRVLDVGTGTAQIPIELCRRHRTCRIVAIDMAAEMLKLGRQNIHAAGLSERITLQRMDAKRLSCPDAAFDAVVSNSIVHHIPEPIVVLREMWRVLKPDGVLFVRDLMRPPDNRTVDSLVAMYAGDANPHQQAMFRASLCAALTVEEMRTLLGECGIPAEWVQATSDRHWTIAGRKPA